MSQELMKEILEIGGSAGVLWVACFFLVRTIKEQYERRIEALEASASLCEEDRRELHKRIEEILAASAKRRAD